MLFNTFNPLNVSSCAMAIIYPFRSYDFFLLKFDFFFFGVPSVFLSKIEIIGFGVVLFIAFLICIKENSIMLILELQIQESCLQFFQPCLTLKFIVHCLVLISQDEKLGDGEERGLVCCREESSQP